VKSARWVLVVLLGALAYESYERITGQNPLAQIAGLFRSEDEAPAQAADTAALPGMPAGDGEPLILSAPPRESPEMGKKRYGPLADLLSRTIGRKVIYLHPVTWTGYQSDMIAGRYDIVFDGPHFVSWRVERRGHSVLAKLPGEFHYLGFARKDEPDVRNLRDLAGKTVCVHAPPNLGTLILLTDIGKTARPPQIIVTEGYKGIYQGVAQGKCVGGMLPKKQLALFDRDGTHMRVIHTHRPIPEQALTAGPRVTEVERLRITDAILAPGAPTVLGAFRETYAIGGWFVRATNQEYIGLSVYLSSVEGFFPG